MDGCGTWLVPEMQCAQLRSRVLQGLRHLLRPALCLSPGHGSVQMHACTVLWCQLPASSLVHLQAPLMSDRCRGDIWLICAGRLTRGRKVIAAQTRALALHASPEPCSFWTAGGHRRCPSGSCNLCALSQRSHESTALGCFRRCQRGQSLQMRQMQPLAHVCLLQPGHLLPGLRVCCVRR